MIADELAFFMSRVKIASPSLMADVFGVRPMCLGTALSALKRDNVLHKVGRNWIYGPRPKDMPEPISPVVKLSQPVERKPIVETKPEPQRLPANSVWEWRG